MTKVPNQPFISRITPSWAYKQSSRRVLVGILYTAPVLAILSVVGSDSPTTFQLIVMTLLFLLGMMSIFWLAGATNRISNEPNKALDERELAARHKIYFYSFRILMLCIAIPFVITNGILPLLQINMPNVPINAINGLLFFIGTTLPIAVAAWTQPDSIEE